jgi:hypothetical protein
MTRESERQPSKQSRYLEAVERCISENTRSYDISGATGTLFDLTNGQIYRNRSDKFIKDALHDGANQTAIRITKPSHFSEGVAGSYYNHIQETNVIIQIDVMSRLSDDFANDILRILESLFFDGVEKEIDGVTLFIHVARIEVQDAYEDGELEASHAVLSITGHYRDNLSA